MHRAGRLLWRWWWVGKKYSCRSDRAGRCCRYGGLKGGSEHGIFLWQIWSQITVERPRGSNVPSNSIDSCYYDRSGNSMSVLNYISTDSNLHRWWKQLVVSASRPTTVFALSLADWLVGKSLRHQRRDLLNCAFFCARNQGHRFQEMYSTLSIFPIRSSNHSTYFYRYIRTNIYVYHDSSFRITPRVLK